MIILLVLILIALLFAPTIVRQRLYERQCWESGQVPGRDAPLSYLTARRQQRREVRRASAAARRQSGPPRIFGVRVW